MQIIPYRQKRESMEKLDKERYLKRVIVVCWIALAICFGIKLFGGNLFEIICTNENFMKVCNYADNHWWAFCLINAINNFVLSYFFILAMCQRYTYKKWELFVLIITVCIGVIIKYFCPQVVGLIFDVWQVIVMPCAFSIKTPKRHWNVIIGNVLLIIFQMVSIFLNNIGIIVIISEIFIFLVIFSIDVLLMILLYYLYSNIKSRKEGVSNGN